jgi:glycosyltransferase involved in cell wall biosynthesis
MRVTHISIIHRPRDPRIFHKECQALVAAGYDVHLVVGGPTAAEVDGVRLHSIADDGGRPPARRQGLRLLRAARFAFALRPSVYHLHDPHLIPLGVLLKLAGARVVYDVHENYPDHARGKLRAHPLRGQIKALMWVALEWLARRTMDGFVCASPALARRFPAARTVVVHNFPRHREFEPAGPSYGERTNTLVYAGVIREMRGFWQIAEALALLPSELDCRLRMIGYFRPALLEQEARRLDAWSRIDYMPWQDHAVVVREVLGAKVGLALLHPAPNHHDPIRSQKLFEYMAAGIPVIASDLPPWREIVRGVGCGVVVDPLDPAAIAAAIQDLLERPEEAEAMGRRGREAVEAQFNWDAESPRLLALYRRLAGDPAPVHEDVPERQQVSA